MRKLSELVQSIVAGQDRAHAYIIEGKSGESRSRFIKDLTAGIGCPVMDIVRMDKSGKNGYKTEDANAFAERLGMSPYGNYLIGIIEDAEQMSEVVQNKLLKTLEEPEPRVLIFLSSSRGSELLGTVRSRCSLVRVQEFDGYADDAEDHRSEELMSGVMMLLTQRGAFYEFREFLEKNIKTQEDALGFIAASEERLRKSMTERKGINLCADMIETAEKTSMDIIKGMDKSRALKRFYMELCNTNTRKA